MSLSFFRQVAMLARESFNKRSELMMGASALIISSLAAWVIRYRMFDYYENAKVGFFIVVCCGLWMGLFDSILCICDARDVLERDKFSGLNPYSFVFANVVWQAVHALLQTGVLFWMTTSIIEFPAETKALLAPAMPEYLVTLFLITFAAQMLGLGVSAIVRTSQQALTVAPFILIYELIMSETLFGLPDAVRPLRETTIVRWGLSGLGTIFDIDALPWKAETSVKKIMRQVSYQVTGQVNGEVSSSPVGGLPIPFFDKLIARLQDYITNFPLNPGVLGVNHNLPEYTATAAYLGHVWMVLGVLALAGIVLALVGFRRTVEIR